MNLRKLIAIGISTMLLPGAAGAALVGFPAPDFSGASTRGPLRLADYAGTKNVVLAFYFADFTPV